MTITIYGAGAIGGLTGAYLARAGEDVLLVDKVAEHVEAMNRQGLKITGAAEFTVPVRACLPEDLKGSLGLVFLAVKSQDTQAALDVIVPHVGPDTILVSLQNGMNPPIIAACIGAAKVIPSFINFSANWQSPGHIENGGGAGSICIGEMDGSLTDRLYRLQRLLSNLHPVRVTGNIFGYLWAKQIACSILFAQAVTDETKADVFSNKRFQPMLIALAGEAVKVAQAVGIKLESFDAFEPLKMLPGNKTEMMEAMAVLDGVAAHHRKRVKVRTGFWRDLAVRRRPTEIDYLTGWVISEGRKRGISMPLNEYLVAQVKEIEQGKRQRGLHNLEELEKMYIKYSQSQTFI